MRDPSIVQLVPERILAISAFTPLDSRVSWVLPPAQGWDPCNVYVILDQDVALIVDTGLACHKAAIISGLRNIFGNRKELWVFLTRTNEFECIGNLASLLYEFPVTRILGNTDVNPLEYFRDSVSADHPHVKFERQRFGDMITLPSGRTLLVVEAAIRTLLTSWLYDTHDGILFSSDCFTHNHVPNLVSKLTITNDDDDQTTPEVVRASLWAKFDWLAIADPTDVIVKLQSVFEKLDVRIIAPIRGRLMLGGSVAAYHRRLTEKAARAQSPVGDR